MHIGAAYFRIDVDQVPEIKKIVELPSTPHFVLVHKNETLYEGDGHDWTTLKHHVSQAIKTAEEDENRTRLSADVPTISQNTSAELIAEVASQFGIDNIEDYEV